MDGWPFARSRSRNAVFGVLSGIAAWAGATTFSIRAVFLLFLFIAPSGAGIGLYFALAILMPIADEPKDESPSPRWGIGFVIFIGIVLSILGPLLWYSVLHYAWQRMVISGAVLLAAIIGLSLRRLRTASNGEERIHVEHRSAVNYAVRAGLAGGVLFFAVDATTPYFAYPIVIGLLIAVIAAFITHNSRWTALSTAFLAVIPAVLVLSIGLPLNAFFAQWYDSQHRSPVYARHYYNYRYVGNTPPSPVALFPGTDISGNVRQGFLAGESTVAVQAPDDNKIVFDGRVTAGSIVVRYVDDNGHVISQTSQSGVWVGKNQTYGNGSKAIHVKVHGGVGRVVLDINRTERT